MSDRQLPFDVEIEQALLGALLVDNLHLASVADILKVEDFYDPLHQRLFGLALRFFAQDRPFTPLTVKGLMEKDEGFVEVGGAAYLKSLAKASTIRPNVKDYGRMLRELSVRRQTIVIAEDLIEAAYSPLEQSIQEIAEEATEQLYEAARGVAKDEGAIDFLELAHRATQLAEDARNAPADVCLTSGLLTVDDALGGIYRGDVTILGAMPSMGKTGLVQHIGVSVARGINPSAPASAPVPQQVLMFSLEMMGEQLATREIAGVAKVPSDKIRRGRITSQELGRLCLAPNEIGRIPLWVDSTPRLAVAQMRARALAHRRRHKSLAMIIIDHLRFVKPANSRLDEKDQIQQITSDIKALAKEMNVAIVLVSHVNRDAMKRTNRRPIVSDLYGSSAIEQNADAIWFVHREAYFLERERPTATSGKPFEEWQVAMDKHDGWTEIFAAKQRMGPISEARVKFDPQYVRYSDPEPKVGAMAIAAPQLFNDLAGLPEKRG